MNNITERLRNAILKYRMCEYSEHDFHLTIGSIESSISDVGFYDLKDFLISIESSLEYIDFMIEKKYWRNEYLKVIDKIELFLDEAGTAPPLSASDNEG